MDRGVPALGARILIASVVAAFLGRRAVSQAPREEFRGSDCDMRTCHQTICCDLLRVACSCVRQWQEFGKLFSSNIAAALL